MILVWILLISVAVIYIFFQVCSVALPQFFLVPTQHWKDKVQQVMEYPTPIYLKVGWKRSSYRRRFVTSSKYPQYYNNFNNNKLKIHPEDCKNEDNYFTDGFNRRDIEDPKRRMLFGFFHPYANNGGGGERVLWQAVYSTLAANDTNIAVIYTVNMEEPANIIKKVENKFNIQVDGNRVVFIYLRKYGKLIDDFYWKHFTLAGQLFGSLVLSLEAMFELSPDIWVDTIGLPGSYYVVSMILKIPILAYVHYPILQQDMFNKLKFGKVKDLAKFSPCLSDVKQIGKFVYWNILYYVYVYLGSLVDVTLTNGTWTFNHMSKIWFVNKKVGSMMEILYPPCNTDEVNSAMIDNERENKLIYIAQFRPEKRHDLVLQQYHQFVQEFKNAKQPVSNLPTIVFLGSCRTEDDTETLVELKQLVKELELSHAVEFIVDCPYSEIQNQLAKVKYGLNAMWNEHFGIGVVEYLSYGVIPISHASAGPLLDIALNKQAEPVTSWKSDTGFFFKSTSDPDFDETIQTPNSGTLKFKQGDGIVEYPDLCGVFTTLFVQEPELVSPEQLSSMRQAGFERVVDTFSNKRFNVEWMTISRHLTGLERLYRESKRTGVEDVH